MLFICDSTMDYHDWHDISVVELHRNALKAAHLAVSKLGYTKRAAQYHQRCPSQHALELARELQDATVAHDKLIQSGKANDAIAAIICEADTLREQHLLTWEVEFKADAALCAVADAEIVHVQELSEAAYMSIVQRNEYTLLQREEIEHSNLQLLELLKQAHATFEVWQTIALHSSARIQYDKRRTELLSRSVEYNEYNTALVNLRNRMEQIRYEMAQDQRAIKEAMNSVRYAYVIVFCTYEQLYPPHCVAAVAKSA
jgi:hypothetical protein